MKRLLLTLSLVWVSVVGYSLDQQFNSGRYYFESSGKSTSANEMPLSPYVGDSLAFARNDTVYTFASQEDMDMGELVVNRKLMALGMAGTFAYDSLQKKIYYVKQSEGDQTVIYEATEYPYGFLGEKKIEIDGIMEVEDSIVGSSLIFGRYNFYHDGVKGFFNPSLANGGKRLYFSGDFKQGKGDRDIWYIDYDADKKTWSRPQSAGDNINTPGREDFPYVVGDSVMYFSAVREDGAGGMDIYMSRYDKASGTWGKAENLDVYNTEDNECNLVGTSKSVYFLSDRAEGRGGVDIFSPAIYDFASDPELRAQKREEEPLDFNWVLFFFDLGKADMKAECEVQLEELVGVMKQFDDVTFVVNGYTDSRGRAETNKRLSKQRADFIKKQLVKRGFNAKRIITAGYGAENPVIPNAQSEAEHEQNRRVEIQIKQNN